MKAILYLKQVGYKQKNKKEKCNKICKNQVRFDYMKNVRTLQQTNIIKQKKNRFSII